MNKVDKLYDAVQFVVDKHEEEIKKLGSKISKTVLEARKKFKIIPTQKAGKGVTTTKQHCLFQRDVIHMLLESLEWELIAGITKLEIEKRKK